jgi:hypothetical protein
MDHTTFHGFFMFVIMSQGKSSSKKRQPNDCMKYSRQLNSNFHMPYDQGVDDRPLHGHFI